MRDSVDKYISTENITVLDAMKLIDKNAKGILYIVDDNNKMLGSVTDGDLRRWIIRTGKIDSCIAAFFNKNTKYVMQNEEKKAIELMHQHKIRSIPVLDSNMRIVDVLFDNEKKKSMMHKDALKGIPVIIMAGGKGTRLYPYTKILPKPLIPIGDIPIIERIMDRFYDYGADEFYLIVNYKKEMIRSYFNEQNPRYKLNYIVETEPLGTAGGIKLISSRFSKPIIVSNCDILIEADYEKALEYHVESQNAMTIFSALRSTKIPYGVLNTKENGEVESIEEKPEINNFVNTGMYIINPDVIDYIPNNTFYHMTDLMNDLILDEKTVGAYPISENSFLDMGEFEEMRKMESAIEHISNERVIHK